jgi:WXG100 family type VII secretion target
MSDKILVNYAALENAHAQMQTTARNLDDKLDTLRSNLQVLQWEGSDADAYHSYQSSWDQAVRDLNALLNEIGGAVNIARENYLSTEQSNAHTWRG